MIDIKTIKSYCCKEMIRKIGRANYICAVCGRPQMTYIINLFDSTDDKYAKTNNKTRRNN